MADALPSRLLVAIGGNATPPEKNRGTPDEQKEIAGRTPRAPPPPPPPHNELLPTHPNSPPVGENLLRPAPIAQLDNELILTHGNGPVVGKILMRQALTAQRIPPMSLDICVAHSQGGIAYLLMQALENALREVDNARHVACLLTQVEVDPDDPA